MENCAFFTLEQCAAYLNTCRSTARNLLERYHILPVDYGKGRSNGLRWHISAVKNLAETLHAEAQNKQSRLIRTSKVARPLYGKSSDELYKEIYGGK